MPPMIEYASFLVRLWRPVDQDEAAQPGSWQGEVEHIQSGKSWSTGSLEELLEFFRREAENPDHLARIDTRTEAV